jgi:type I restriction enzyme M protein
MKTIPIPKWIMERYALLWNKFKDKEFTYLEVSEMFSKDSNNLRRALVSQLRINGWLEVKLSSKDSRKRVFKLKSPEDAVRDMVS